MKIMINYKIVKTGVIPDYEIIDNLSEEIDENIMFYDAIKKLLDKNNVFYSQIFIKDLKKLTWGKFINDERLLDEVFGGNDEDFSNLNYSLKDIQSAFKLFDNKLTIIAQELGIGGIVGNVKGIKFYINNNEKDRHEFEPHVHCKFGKEETRIRIDTLEVMKKDRPFKNSKKMKIAINCIKKYQKGLLDYYNLFAIKGDNNIRLEYKLYFSK